MQNNQPVDSRFARAVRKKRALSWLLWILLAVLAVGIMVIAGAVWGYQSAKAAFAQAEATQGILDLKEQYELAVNDQEAGQYDLARQRFEYVLAKDPSFPGAAEKLAEVMGILYATATPTPLPPTATPSPTPDTRPAEQVAAQAQALFDRAQSLAAGGDWTGAIDTVVNLRQVDASYRVVEVDSILYLSLRSRGVDKIKNRNLEGGIYDLALAERFGPLDAESISFRDIARLYMFGSSFWEAYPEQAVYYFSQVAAAMPGLTDASGWSARERYRAVLIQYGDQLAAQEEWCDAEAQYALALNIRSDDVAGVAHSTAYENCYEPEPTETEEIEVTEAPTVIPTETPTTPVATAPLETEDLPATETPTTPVPTTETPPTEPVLPTETNTPEPSPETTEPPTEVPSPEVTEPSTPEVTEPPPPELTQPVQVTESVSETPGEPASSSTDAIATP